jgi:hypothetical protein
VKSLLPQRSLKAKNLIQDGEKTVLIVPDTPPSDSPAAKPSTSRSFSLNKVLFPLKSTNSLPVTPSANSDPEALQERNVNSCSDYDVRILFLLLLFFFQKFGESRHDYRLFSMLRVVLRDL